MANATSTSDPGRFLAAARASVDAELEALADRLDAGPPADRAIAYALRGAGKRLRPALLLATYRELGGRADAARLAAAVEIVHTYSLVHDDLPCMDDDDLRRGRATVHRAFDPPTAVEAGFRMVPLAARVLADGAGALGLDSQRVGELGRILYVAVGAAGMIGGQMLDLEAEGRKLEEPALRALHARKTGALIAASAEMGAVAAGAATVARRAVRDWGAGLGLAFQIVDDVLDATGTARALGKTPGKDAAQDKSTFVDALGVAGAEAAARREIAHAMDRLGDAGLDSPLLRGLAGMVVERRS